MRQKFSRTVENEDFYGEQIIEICPVVVEKMNFQETAFKPNFDNYPASQLWLILTSLEN